MNCSAIGHSTIIYHWQQYNTISSEWTTLPRNQQTYTNGISTYTLALLTKNDDGLYRCVATNIDGSGYSNNVTITVYGMYNITVDISIHYILYTLIYRSTHY